MSPRAIPGAINESRCTTRWMTMTSAASAYLAAQSCRKALTAWAQNTRTECSRYNVGA